MIVQYWEELTAVALLGTDRRMPPAPPAGPLADLAADLAVNRGARGRVGVREGHGDGPLGPDPAHLPLPLLDLVGAAAVVLRAGMVPLPALADVAELDHDPRPPTPPATEAVFRRITGQWPVLLEEWLAAVHGNGWRLGSELVIPVLLATRRSALLGALALQAAGPVGRWLIEQWPALAPSARPGEVPGAPLPLTSDLAALVDQPAERVAATLRSALEAGQLGASHRAVLINLIVSLPAASLPAVAAALGTIDPLRPVARLAGSLADLAALRRLALSQLEHP